MGRTAIEWADESWNPITGCSHAGSPGCDHCYARRMAKRLAGRYGYPERPHEFDVTFHPDKLGEPLRWRKPRVVFVCSMGDLFHKDVDVGHMIDIWNVMVEARQHIFLLLTKRPQEMRQFAEYLAKWLNYTQWPDHIWPGVTIETQDQMWRVEELLKIPAAKRFVSFEPLLGDVGDIQWHLNRYPFSSSEGTTLYLKPGIDGVIVGGESGPGARIMDPDWARSIRDQCLPAGVGFTFKQHGEYWTGEKGRIYESGRYEMWSDGRQIVRCGKKAAGRELDGKVWDQFPWELLGGNADLGVGGPRE